VFVAIYTANLVSYSIIIKSKDIISGIDDINNGKLQFNLVGVLLNTLIEEYYLEEISVGA
jgi:hypothetical protein